MKLLSDFDGVWTDPTLEAAAQGECLDETLLSWSSPNDRERVAEWIRGARAASLREPARYGWAPGGRISAFADEDPFAAHSALLHYLHVHAETDPMARGLCTAIRQNGFETLDAFGGHTHSRGVERVTAERGPGILPAAAEAGRQLLAANIEVVVVSNSTPDKLVRWFDHAGVPNTRHPEHKPGSLRVRGSARKFELHSTNRESLDLGTVQVAIGRPAYEAILRDERPDAVVGDVFSLDLALPLALKRRDPDWRGTRLFWLIHPYTPAWLRSEIAGAAGGEIEAVHGGLPALARTLTAS